MEFKLYILTSPEDRAAVAKEIGISKTKLDKMVAGRAQPKLSLEQEVDLYKLTGKTVDALFPNWRDRAELGPKNVKTRVRVRDERLTRRAVPPEQECIIRGEISQFITESTAVSERDAAIVVAAVCEEESHEDIAQKFGISHKEVDLIITRSLAHIRHVAVFQKFAHQLFSSSAVSCSL